MVGAVAVAVAVIVFWPRMGTPGWTGASIAVPSCPADADGCRISVVNSSSAGQNADVPVVAQKDWSGAATTLKVLLPVGTYAVSAAGCAGYKIADTQISVTSGYHVGIDLGASWELLGYVGRGCPGFMVAP